MKVTPYHKNIARSLLKEPKYYFYDNAMVSGDLGVKLENIVACSLLKEIEFLEDIKGDDIKLHYLRNKDGRELDFLIVKDNLPRSIVEVKWSDDKLPKNFSKFFKANKSIKKIQVTHNLKTEKTFPSGEEIRSAINFLSDPLKYIF